MSEQLKSLDTATLKPINLEQDWDNVRQKLNFEELANYSLIIGNVSPYRPELIKSLALLSLKLKDKLTNYDTILIDDASGRLVGLYLLEQIKAKKRNEGISTKTMAYGIIGGDISDEQKNAVKNFIKTKKNKLGKTLLVTEQVLSGEAIIRIAKLLKQKRINFDIASVSVNPEFLNSKNKHRWAKNKLTYGSLGLDGSDFKHIEKGVTKRSPLTNSIDESSPHPQKDKYSNQSTINASRKYIRYLAQNILQTIA